METDKSFLEKAFKAFLSEDEKEIVSILYEITDSAGSFIRRFILKEGDNSYFILHKDCLKEPISEIKLKNILEMEKGGTLYSGSSRCSIYDIENLFKEKEKIGYWIVEARKAFEAEKILPFVSALFLKLKRVKKEEKESDYFALLGNLLSSCRTLTKKENFELFLKTFLKTVEQIFFSDAAIVGFEEKGKYEIFVKEKGRDAHSFVSLIDPTSLIEDKVFEHFGESADYALRFYETFGVKAGNFVVVKPRFHKEKLNFFVIVTTEKKPEKVFLDFLDYSISLLYLFRLIDGYEKSEKNLVECLNLMVKQGETKARILNSLPDGIIALSEKGSISFCNKKAEELLEINKIEIAEKTLFRSKEPGKTILSLISKVAEEKKSIYAPLNFKGKVFDVYVSEMEPSVFLVVCSDITELSKDIEDRKHLFSLITHEVKNPLAAVLSASEMFYSERAGKIENPQLKRLSEIIYKNAKQMREILDEVSAFGKSLFVTGSEISVDVKNLIDKIVEEKEETLKAKDITVFKEISEISILCNPAMMETLLSNIIGNAIKYSSVKGSVGIKLSKMGDKILLEVVDDGIGIPEEDIEKIGQPFFRAENVRENVSGTGFGLSIVKNIVSRLRGTFKVLSPISKEDKIFIHSDSESSRGTKVVITFPLIGGEDAG